MNNIAGTLERRMLLTQVRHFALRLTITQNATSVAKSKSDKLVFPTAFLLAGIGVGVSSFSLKQLITNPKQH